MISDADRKLLLRIARDGILAHVSGSPPPPTEASEGLRRHAGAFVTLHAGEQLRGCIGHVQSDQPLWQVVRECAVAASARDPRFSPVTPVEVPQLQIELSILGALEPVAALDEVEIGRHGLVVGRGWQRGLLLPQVATEWRWDRRTFMEQTCHKAGLSRDAWQHGATAWKFEAEVFSEGGWGR